jgi:two-component sensor histidine kinase
MALQTGNSSAAVLRSYLLALLIFAAALLVRLLLDHFVPGRLPFITFFPAVLAAVYYCGLWPSILVLLLSALVGTYWVEPAPGSDATTFYVLSFGLFLAISALNIALMHYLIKTLAQVKERDEQLSLINRELKHRIKNLFSIANSVCLQTIKSGSSVEDMSNSVSGRIMAIAAAQDLLSTTATNGADLRELVSALVTTLAPHPSRLAAAGATVQLPADVTTPFALVLHELGTNALKYGAWSHETGEVILQWDVQSSVLQFNWREHNGPTVGPAVREGLGSALIKRSLPGASVTHEIKPDGLECDIKLPLA